MIVCQATGLFAGVIWNNEQEIGDVVLGTLQENTREQPQTLCCLVMKGYSQYNSIDFLVISSGWSGPLDYLSTSMLPTAEVYKSPQGQQFCLSVVLKTAAKSLLLFH